MPRPNQGPRLELLQPKGNARPLYYIVFYEQGKRRERATGTDDLQPAQEALAAHILGRKPKPEGPRDPADYPIAEALSLYGTEKAAKNEDKGARAGHAIAALLGFWGGKNVDAITEHTTVGQESGYVTWRTSQWVPGIKNEAKQRRVDVGTARRELICLRSAVQYAWKAKQITSAPFVQVPPKSDPKDVWMTPQFAAALVRASRARKDAHAAVKGYLPYYMLTMLYTGTRPGAALRLQWVPNLKGGHIDLEKGILYRAPHGLAKKNKKQQTPVSIPPRLLHLLHYLRKRTRQYVFERNGLPIKKLRRAYQTAVRAALKLFPEMDGMKVTPHTARHTAATWLLQRGVDAWEAAGYLGMTTETLEETYGHHSPEFQAGAKAAFSKHPKRANPPRNPPATNVKERQAT